MRLGILGGGQLALFLATAAKRLNCSVVIFASDRQCPASIYADEVVEGSLSDVSALNNFFRLCDVVTFENEFIDVDALRQTHLESTVRILPEPETVFNLSHKLWQKDVLASLNIPSPDFIILDNELGDVHAVVKALEYFNGDCVLKWNRFGYDGKGVLVCTHDLPSIEQATGFIKKAWSQNITVFAEQKISFTRELAMVAVRSIDGDFVHYPLVISRQENGVCKEIIGPASAFDFNTKKEQALAHAMRACAEHVGLVGAFAFEFFETDAGDILVNEIAPRVHNSAHYTIDACSHSQFDNHLRAILGMPLSVNLTAPYFAMRNLLGPCIGDFQCSHTHCKMPLSVRLYWYHKQISTALRKLGHLNACARTAAELKEQLREMAQFDSDWTARLIANADGDL